MFNKKNPTTSVYKDIDCAYESTKIVHPFILQKNSLKNTCCYLWSSNKNSLTLHSDPGVVVDIVADCPLLHP